jgi:hypothetical protein
VGLVAPRILTITTTAGQIVSARDELGIRIARLKDEVTEVGPLGIQRDLGSTAIHGARSSHGSKVRVPKPLP